jgi:DNA-binding beta-propeller fold protein YncE
MMARSRVLAFLTVLLLAVAGWAANIDAVLPNGRRIRPVGTWRKLAPYPFALAVRGDGRQIVVPSIGWPFSLNIVERPGMPRETVRQIPGERDNDPGVEVHAGVAYSPDGTLLYDATGDSGSVDVWETQEWTRVARIALGPESFAATVALSRDGKLLYALDQGNWRVLVVDPATRRVLGSAPTGVNPLEMALAPDGHRLYVTNSGLFEYKTLPGVTPGNTLATGLRFPPFGYPSKEARAVLGDENSVKGSSLWTYAVGGDGKLEVTAKLRLGRRIADDTVGGAAPAGVAADGEQVYVALAHEDTLAVVTADGAKVEREIVLTPFSGREFADRRGRALRGVMPAGVTVGGGRIYVTEAGINAVAVVDQWTGRVLGHMPVGWYPAAAALSPDGKTLWVVNSKGKGAGPNGGEAGSPDRKKGNYIGAIEFGSLSGISTAGYGDLEQNTREVVANNLAARRGTDRVPRVKHVFLVIRENRTFDEVLGDLPGVNGAPRLARWGREITPNAHAMAERFGTSDAFFVDSDVSADGHRWAVGAAPAPWMNMSWTSNYGGRRAENWFSGAPGRRALGGGADGPMPEDEPEFGMLWEHIAGSGLSVRNYGEGLELEGSDEMDGAAPEGQRLTLDAPVPEPVYVSTDWSYPTFNLGIPDQFRYEEFARDFAELVQKGRAPALTVIRLPGDHTAKPRPGDGYPYRASYVADNDLALGKMVDWISHSAIWKDSALIAIEDDAQGGVDHVDAHRSVLVVASPYARPGHVSHRHASMGSVQKTIYEMLGIGPLNLEDGLAGDLGDMFQAAVDLEPYTARPANARVFDARKARVARPKSAAEAKALLDCDDPRQMRREMDADR